MFVFWKIGRVLFSWNARFKIRPFTLLPTNYTGSFTGMEIAGATKVFSSSEEKHGLHHTYFYEYGDNKAYSAAKHIYCPRKPIKKFEWVGYYQKRVRSRLRSLKKKPTKGLGKKGKLTNTKIDTIQNYFGYALCLNVGNLAAMKSVCMASMYYICDYHNNFPKSADTSKG